MKSRRPRWVGHDSIHGGKEKCIKHFGQKIPKEKMLGKPMCRRRIILKWILGKYGVMVLNGFTCLRRDCIVPKAS